MPGQLVKKEEAKKESDPAPDVEERSKSPPKKGKTKTKNDSEDEQDAKKKKRVKEDAKLEKPRDKKRTKEPEVV